MAAGLGFKTFTTGEVLTAADTNGYLMQGINVFASTAARDAAITSPQEGQFAFTKDTNGLWYYDGAAWVASGATGDIEGVTAGIGISGGGTSGTVTVTNSMATAIDAKGDLVPGTGADTFSRLAVGANDTVLTADSTAATGMKWATPASGGSMTVLASGSLSGAGLTISSISASYTDLRFIARDFYGSVDGAYLTQSVSAGAGNFVYAQDLASTKTLNGDFNTTNTRINNQTLKNISGKNVYQFELFNYSTAQPHLGQTYFGAGQSTGTQQYFLSGGYYNQDNTVVTSLTFSLSAGTFSAGTYVLYGVK